MVLNPEMSQQQPDSGDLYRAQPEGSRRFDVVQFDVSKDPAIYFDNEAKRFDPQIEIVKKEVERLQRPQRLDGKKSLEEHTADIGRRITAKESEIKTLLEQKTTLRALSGAVMEGERLDEADKYLHDREMGQETVVRQREVELGELSGTEAESEYRGLEDALRIVKTGLEAALKRNDVTASVRSEAVSSIQKAMDETPFGVRLKAFRSSAEELENFKMRRANLVNYRKGEAA